MLAREGLGAELIPLPDGRCRARVYLHSGQEVGGILEAVGRKLAARGIALDDCSPEASILRDGHWAERYQERLRPFPLGRRFTVYPAPEGAPTNDPTAIVLVPGRAFGTGDHPTTQLCAEALERHVRPGSRWADLGCGSGILSVVARRCGAATVWAVDHDPEAVEVATEVLRRNGVEERVELVLGSAEDCPRGCWDGIAANVAAEFFIDRAAALRALLAPGGTLLVTGILQDDERAVVAALGEVGLTVYERREGPPWVLLSAHHTVSPTGTR